VGFDYHYVLPPTGAAENSNVREMFDDVRNYVNTLISGGGTGAPNTSQYVTLIADASLTSERVLTAGLGISLTDNGAGSTVVVTNTGVRSLSTSNVNSSFSASTGAITFSFSPTPTFSSIIFQSASGAIGIAPSASMFSSYNLILPLDTGTSGYVLSTDGATPTATLSWVSKGIKAITGTTDQISVDNSGDPIVLSTPQDIGTSSHVQFGSLKVAAGLVSDTAIKFNDTDTGFYQPSGGAGFVNLALNGAIGTVWTPSDKMLWNTGPVKALNFQVRNSSGNIVTIQSPSIFSDWTLTLPTDDGTANQFLQTDGSGNTTWADFSSLGATKALDNLASVAINTTLLPGITDSIDLGSASKTWRNVYIAGDVSFQETGGGTDTITIEAPSAITSSYAIKLPGTQGSSNTFLKNDGSGNLTWSTSAGTGATTALDNLASVALNTSLLPASDNAIDLGSATKEFRSAYLKTSLIFQESGVGTDTITLQAPSSIAAGYTLTLPVDDGTPAQILQTDGSGVLSWVSQSGSGTVNSGTITDLAYYASSSTAVSATSLLTIDSTNHLFTFTDAVAGTMKFLFTNTQASSTAVTEMLLKGQGSSFIAFDPNGASGSWSIGVDRGDSGKFKISNSTTIGTNDSLTITTGGLVTITAATNQLQLGTSNTVTISSTAPATSRVYTIPDVRADSTFTLKATAPGDSSVGIRSTQIFDYFDRSDRTLSGDYTPTNTQWVLSGAGATTAAISNGMYIVTDNTYASLDYGSKITRISGAISYLPSTGADDITVQVNALIADVAQIGLSTMLHLQFSPQGWDLVQYVTGTPTTILSGVHSIPRDGSVYSMAMEIVGNTVSVIPPQGPIKSYTNASIGSTTYRYGIWQTTANGTSSGAGSYARWHSANLGWNVGQSNRAQGQGLCSSVVDLLGTQTNDNARSGFKGEFLQSSNPGVVAASGTGTFKDYATLSLTSGDWDISGGIEMDPNGSTNTGFQIALSLSSGNTTTDHVVGYNTIVWAQTITGTEVYTPFIPIFRVSVSTTTTVYLKMRWNFTIGTPQGDSGLISARRIR
jgi:hypothetical protein